MAANPGLTGRPGAAERVARLEAAVRRRVALLGVLTIVTYGSWYYGFGVLFDDLKRGLGSSDRQLAYGFGLAELLTGILGVAAGRTLDRRGARGVLLVGASLGGGLLAAASLASGPWSFAVCFGVGGGVIGATGFYAMTQTISARLAPGQEPAAIARLTIWGAFSSPLFIPLTGFVNDRWGWRSALRLDAVVVAVSYGAAVWVLHGDDRVRSDRPSASPVVAVRLALRDRRIRRLVGSACAAAAGSAILLVYQVPLLVAAGTSAALASTLAGARGLAQLLGRLPLTRVIDAHGVPRSLRAARAMLAAGCLLIILAGNPVLAVGYVLLAGISIGAMSPLDGIYARQSLPAADLGTLMGGVALLTSAAGALGPIVAAVVVDATGHRWAAALLAAGSATVGAVTLATRD